MILTPRALIVFYDEQHRVLLQNRTNIIGARSPWGFFGGKLEEGETAEEAVVRETKEELKYTLTTFSLLGTFTDVDEHDCEVTLSVFTAPFPGMNKLVLCEGADMRLFSVQEVRSIGMSRRDNKVLDDLERFFEKK